jgi:cation:H+ antiporter
MTHSLTPTAGIKYWFRLFFPFLIAFGIAVPGVLFAPQADDIDPVLGMFAFGGAVVAGAFVLSWISEAAELDLRGGLSIALLAVIAILPEYVVDFYFAYAAGLENAAGVANPVMASYASANLTGANRLLLGLGWPAMAFFGYIAMRKLRDEKTGLKRKFGVTLESDARVDLAFLVVASLIALIVPLTKQFDIFTGSALIILFALYLYRVSKQDKEEPELEGIPALVGALPKWTRRAFLFVAAASAAFVIIVVAEPFAHSLIEAGKALKIDEFILVQWLAPLASEAPEFIIAIMFALRGKPGIGLAILISSKVNQWTALAGSLPIGYALGGGQGALPMDAVQVEEFTLTIAQTVFGIAILLSLHLGKMDAIALFSLFTVTLVFPDPDIRIWVAYLYFAIAIPLIIYRYREFVETLKAPFKV